VPEQRFVRRNLEQLRKQARELLRKLRSGDAEALGRLSAQFQVDITPQLAHALAVIARENGYDSWPKLKADLEQATTVVGQPVLKWRRRKGPKRLPSRQLMEELYAYTLLLVELGDPAEFALRPSPSGEYGKTISRSLRALLVERGDLKLVVELALRGLEHPNPKVRYNCAHALDWLSDDRCVPALVHLLNDPVPRVRAIALHALNCDECKLTPLQPRPELIPIAIDWAAHDPSRRVRRDATWLLMQAAEPGLARHMRSLATTAADSQVRELAASYLRRHSPARPHA
jgi:HEAT repeats